MRGAAVVDPVACCAHLSENDRSFLLKVQQHLPLLADLTRSDVLLYVKAEAPNKAEVVGQGQPHTVPPIYADSLLGTTVTPAENPAVFRVLARGKSISRPNTVLVRGAPTVQSAYPVISQQGVIGALSVETNLLERERQRKKSLVYRNAIAQVRQMVLLGRLEGGANLSRLGEHDGSLVVNSRGQILYVSSIAENLYRKLGYTYSLLHRRIGELKSDESAFFQALETGGCVEQVAQEQPFTWVKRAIPLAPTLPYSWLRRFYRRERELDGAVIILQDITEEQRKEQELRVKGTMMQEVHHRVKNNLQRIAALLRLQARRTGTPDAAEILQQTIHRILSIAVVHEFLSQDEASAVDLRELGQRIANELTQSFLYPEKRIRFILDGDPVSLPAQQATSCALIVNELLQNAVEHGYPSRAEGTVRISLRNLGDELMLEIADDGQGLAPDFNLAHDGSLGLQIVTMLVKEDLRGRFELVAGYGNGVRALVTFPKIPHRWDSARLLRDYHPSPGERRPGAAARALPALDAEVAKNLL